MSTPPGWDDKSWLDVLNAHEQAARIVAALRVEIGKEDASADHIERLFSDLQEAAATGAMAASWCKS